MTPSCCSLNCFRKSSFALGPLGICSSCARELVERNPAVASKLRWVKGGSYFSFLKAKKKRLIGELHGTNLEISKFRIRRGG